MILTLEVTWRSCYSFCCSDVDGEQVDKFTFSLFSVSDFPFSFLFQVNFLSLPSYEENQGHLVFISFKTANSDNDGSKIAYVTFRNSEGSQTAVLLTGAMVAGERVSIALAPEYTLPDSVASAIRTASENSNAGSAESGYRKAEDVVSSMLAKGFILGKDALNRAKSFDEKHQFTSTAAAKVSSLDQKIGLSEKLSMGTTLVNYKVKEMDEKYQVSEKTKIALSAAEQSVSNAGSAIMKNRYVFTGAAWVTGAFNRVAKAAEDVGQKTREKVMAEDQQRIVCKIEKTKIALSAAEQSVSNAGSAIMKNRYVFTGAAWVTGAFNRVAKAAEDVGQKTREKVMAEDQVRVGQTQMNIPVSQPAGTANQPPQPPQH
ncbi:binding partner of ACD11 1 [Senna tora]|uniref:Binding partner of ACD11 1 n=1 Tax=Senna tora TaxID=362788 RepID=A0A834X1G1_9FABA|nr:binding partner of ACD11 1 [Senna tora]